MNKYERTYRIVIRLDDNKTDLVFISSARNMQIAGEVAARYALIAALEEDSNFARVLRIEEI